MDMKTIGEIRLENLELLVADSGTLETVAGKAGTTSVYLSQIRNGALDQKTGRPRQMGDQMARRLELAHEKPKGWMDTPHPPLGPDKRVPGHGFEFDGRGGNIDALPVEGTVRVDREEFVIDRSQAGGFILGSGVFNGYAVRIRGDGPVRSLRDGQYLVIERDGNPEYSDYCILPTRDGDKLIEIRARRGDGTVSAEVVFSGDRLTLERDDLDGVECVVAVVSASRYRPHAGIEQKNK
ncbi:hypothetical protein J7E49_06730 [Variovorax paradoxus]|nr:hypothetical protein [Variovorax paradoxus]